MIKACRKNDVLGRIEIERTKNMKQNHQSRCIFRWMPFAIAAVMICAMTGCSSTSQIEEDAVVPVNAPVEETGSSEEMTGEAGQSADSAANTTEDTTIRVVAVGDNLVQQYVYQSAQAHSTDGSGYNFDYCYENIKPLINGDLNIINQETLICGGDYEISGSNFNFNSPVELGDAVINAGFNVITLCNNHLMDKGVGGLSSCLDYWDSKKAEDPELVTYGTYRDYMDMQNIRTTVVNGKTVAFLGYTEHLNGYSIPDNSELEVVDTEEENTIQAQIAKANEIADVVIVTCHWGVEDTFNIAEEVKTLSQKIIDWGADVIVGTHPHVAHGMEYLTRPDGSQGFVFYSLGNFISAQTDNFNLVGELANFNLVVHADNSVTVEQVQVSPVITHYEGGSQANLRLYPYSMYTEELASQHGLPYCTSSTGPSYQVWNMDKIREIFDTAVPAEFQKLD